MPAFSGPGIWQSRSPKSRSKELLERSINLHSAKAGPQRPLLSRRASPGSSSTVKVKETSPGIWTNGSTNGPRYPRRLVFPRRRGVEKAFPRPTFRARSTRMVQTRRQSKAHHDEEDAVAPDGEAVLSCSGEPRQVSVISPPVCRPGGLLRLAPCQCVDWGRASELSRRRCARRK